MKSLILFLVAFAVLHVNAVFDYDRAAIAYQKNDQPQASRLISSLLVDNPADPALLYDAGVVAYKQKNYQQACTYFQRARDAQKVGQELSERINFNLGNTHVKQKNLQEALDAYEKVLRINPENEKARHNRDKVKEMMEQQKQEQNNQNNDQSSNDAQKNSESSDNKSDNSSKKNKDKNTSDKKTDDDQSGSDQDDSDQEKKSGDDRDDKDDASKFDNKKETSKKDQKKSGSEKSKNKNKEDSKTDPAGADKQTEQQKKDEQERRRKQQERDDKERFKQERKSQSGKSADSSDDSGQQEEQPIQQNAGIEKLDAGLAQLVQEQAQADADLNKQLIKLIVEQQAKRNQHGPQW